MKDPRIERLGVRPGHVAGPCQVRGCRTVAGFTLSYLVERKGQVTEHRRPACRRHAENFSQAYGVPLPAAGKAA